MRQLILRDPIESNTYNKSIQSASMHIYVNPRQTIIPDNNPKHNQSPLTPETPIKHQHLEKSPPISYRDRLSQAPTIDISSPVTHRDLIALFKCAPIILERSTLPRTSYRAEGTRLLPGLARRPGLHRLRVPIDAHVG